MSCVYLIRHGQASFMKSDYDKLSNLGVEQCQILGRYLHDRNITFDFTISGTLERQKETLFLALGKTADHQSDFFNEHHGPAVFKDFFPTYLQNNPDLAGQIQSKGIHDPRIKKQLVKIFYKMHLRWAKADMGSSQHESWFDFKRRVHLGFEYLQEVASQYDSVALFSSGGAIAEIIGTVLGLEDEKTIDLNWQIKNTAISTIKYRSGKFLLSEFNGTPHLNEDLVTFV